MSGNMDLTLEASRASLYFRKRREFEMAPPLLHVGTMMPSRHWVTALVAFLIVSLFLVVGCSEGANCNHSCPISDFAVIVPTDRIDDVASITPTGPCTSESATGFAPGVYFFYVTGDGVCPITVSFRSGAPDFVASVSIVPNAGPCCVGQPTAEKGNISVPDLGSLDASSGN